MPDVVAEQNKGAEGTTNPVPASTGQAETAIAAEPAPGTPEAGKQATAAPKGEPVFTSQDYKNRQREAEAARRENRDLKKRIDLLLEASGADPEKVAQMHSEEKAEADAEVASQAAVAEGNKVFKRIKTLVTGAGMTIDSPELAKAKDTFEAGNFEEAENMAHAIVGGQVTKLRADIKAEVARILKEEQAKGIRVDAPRATGLASDLSGLSPMELASRAYKKEK